MRKVLVFVTALAVALGTGFPARGAGAGASAGQFAVADWTVWTSATHGIWYVALAERGVYAPFVTDEAAVLRGTCERHRSKHGFTGICSATGRGHELSPTEFRMDPTLASADLTFTSGRYTQEVHWTGTGEGPMPGEGADVDPSSGSVGMAGGEVRGAKAEAHIFGRYLRPKRGQFAFMVMDGEVYAGAVAVSFHDHEVEARRTLRS